MSNFRVDRLLILFAKIKVNEDKVSEYLIFADKKDFPENNLSRRLKEENSI